MTSRLRQIAVFVRVSLRSRLAWILVCFHAAWFFLAIANMAPPSHAFAKWLESGGSDMTVYAGRPFHFTYESFAMKLLVFADLPSMIAEIPIGFLATPLMRFTRMDLYSGSYVGAAVDFLLASAQWLALGKFFELRLSSSNWGKAFLYRVQRSFVSPCGFRSSPHGNCHAYGQCSQPEACFSAFLNLVPLVSSPLTSAPPGAKSLKLRVATEPSISKSNSAATSDVKLRIFEPFFPLRLFFFLFL